MNFSEQEIQIAEKIHSLLPWNPKTGNYVYDIKGIIEKSSPFQNGVYFILDIKHFIKRAGSVEGIKDSMCWLPLWEDCRKILADLKIDWDQIQNRLTQEDAFKTNTERLTLYKIILEKIEAKN